ncbi:hypothetical protein J4E08_16665 [Sagittula sp. NFXS13]|nr:hypothetical protein [Sagittula marina]
MMTTTLALLILFGSALMVLANLRSVVQDTYEMLRVSTKRFLDKGELTRRTAFALLWLLIFTLSFWG